MNAKQIPMHEVLRGLAEVFTSVEQAVCQTLTALDPWAQGFQDAAWQAVNEQCSAAWPRMRELMPDRPDRSILQQAWAARFEARVHAGLLYRAGLSNPDTESEARRLRRLTLARRAQGPGAAGDPRHRELVRFLMAEDAEHAGVPDLGRHTGYRGSIRLRYRVAHTCRQGAGLGAVLEVAATQPAATTYQRKVEFERAVRAATEAGRNWRRLGEQEFSLLSRPSQELLLQSSKLWPMVLAQSLMEGGDVAARCESSMRQRDRISAALNQLMAEIRARRFGAVEAILSRIPETPLARALCNRLKEEPWELRDVTSHASMRDEFGPWVPLTPPAFSRLQAWAPEPLPRWWAMTGPEFAERVCAGEFDIQPRSKTIKLLSQDLAPIRRTWSEPVQHRLIRSGYGHLLIHQSAGWFSLPLKDLATALMDIQYGGIPILAKRLEQLPDAQAWLAVMADAPTAQHAQTYREIAQRAIDIHWRHRWDYGWGRWIVRAYGCEGWEKVEAVALARTTPLKDAVSVFAAGKQPLFPGSFQAVVARSLAREEMLPKKPLTLLKAWLVRDPLAARALAEHAPVDWVERLARNAATPLQTLDVFIGHERLSAEVKRLAWRNRLARTRDGRELSALAARMPAGLGVFRNLSQWLVQGPAPAQATGLVLVGRRDGARLKQLHQQWGGEAFEQACAAATGQLNEQVRAGLEPAVAKRAQRDAAVLELLQHLGGEHACALLKALAGCDHQASSGCKLDGSYALHTVPKRNGGERVIQAPAPQLKQVQRAIADRLLAPLGVHPAACGFVKGRSIVDNARPHVGQPVVVNADIRNCFPSVRWSLVLGVLRRELGDRLSPTAISLLVDLTTAQGALPVGAPSSPALLNLVLRRTDEVLQGQADRLGAHYTRYADDLTFSGSPEAIGLLKLAERTLSQIGLELDPRKTNVFRRGRRQLVTGLAVNDQVSVPRAARRRLRASVHQVEQGGALHWEGAPQDMASLKGRLGFLAMVQPAHGQALIGRLNAAIAARAAIRSAASSAKRADAAKRSRKATRTPRRGSES